MNEENVITENQQVNLPEQGSVATPAPRPRNGLGIAGMIVSIVGAVFCWVPGFNFLLLVTGFVLSLVAVFLKRRKGAAIAGLIVSTVFIIIAFGVMVLLADELEILTDLFDVLQ